jgi:VIT1/CCC1 family predicted Fe2+/Mn2+ transporter
MVFLNYKMPNTNQEAKAMTENKEPDYSEKSDEKLSESAQATTDRSNQPEIFKVQSPQGGCLQLFLGFLAALVFLVIAFFIMLGVGKVSTPAMSMIGVLFLFFLGGGLVIWRRSHLRMFVIGYLIGLGLSALAFGLCISILPN